MNKFIFTGLVLVLTSCEKPQTNGSAIIQDGYTIRKIGKCEYIEFENSSPWGNNYSYSLTHNGECPNPIHKCKCEGN